MNRTIRFGNILDAANEVGINIIVQGVNCQGVMGSGVAKAIRQKYPEVFDPYSTFVQKFGAGNPDLLGHIAPYVHEESELIIINAFTQLNFGSDGKKYVSYEAIQSAFKRTITTIAGQGPGVSVHYPMIGAGLGGGDWTIISDIINGCFSKAPTVDHYLWIKE